MSEPLPAPSSDTDSNAAPPQAPPPPPAGGRGARVALAVAVLAALVALFWPRSAPAPKSAIGGFLVDEEGHATAVADTLGKTTLIHFWASWCPPCQEELPKMVSFARLHAKDGLEVVFVAVADEPKVARRFLAAPEVPLRFDPTWDVAHRFGTEKLPETHLVVGGKVVGSFIGPADWDDPEVLAKIQKWMASPTSPKP